MHSRIFELTQANLDRDDWATEDNFVYDEEKMDYSEELHGDERTESIDWLENSPLGGLFVFDKDTLTFKKDALMDARKDWIASIKKALEVMENKCLYDTFGLRYATKTYYTVISCSVCLNTQAVGLFIPVNYLSGSTPLRMAQSFT